MSYYRPGDVNLNLNIIPDLLKMCQEQAYWYNFDFIFWKKHQQKVNIWYSKHYFFQRTTLRYDYYKNISGSVQIRYTPSTVTAHSLF